MVECIRLIFHTSRDLELINRYKGTTDPQEHIWLCERWIEKQIPKEQWVHRFVHTMDMVPRS